MADKQREKQVMPDTSAFIDQLREQRDAIVMTLRSRRLPGVVASVDIVLHEDIERVIDALIDEETT